MKTLLFGLFGLIFSTGLSAQTGGWGYPPIYQATVTAGAATCDFAQAPICLVNNTSASPTNPLVMTVTHLPTNEYIRFIFQSQKLIGVTWPSNFYCEEFDGFNTCAGGNYAAGNGWIIASPNQWTGSGPTNGFYHTEFWSDGVNAWGGGGMGTNGIQTLNASHVNVDILDVYQNTNGSFIGGTLLLAFGSQLSLGQSSYVTAAAGSFWTDVVPSAVASASTIAPTSHVFHVTGTTTINTITPPASCTAVSASSCEVKIIPDGIFATGITGNIAIASTAVVSKMLIETYDANTSKWYPSY